MIFSSSNQKILVNSSHVSHIYYEQILYIHTTLNGHSSTARCELVPIIQMEELRCRDTRSLAQVYAARSQMQVCLTSKTSYLPEHVARGKDILFSGSLLIEKLETRLGEDGELA